MINIEGMRFNIAVIFSIQVSVLSNLLILLTLVSVLSKLLILLTLISIQFFLDVIVS